MRPMRLTDGIYKVAGMRVANVYLVVIEDGLLLVDSGMPTAAGKMPGQRTREDVLDSRLRLP